MAEQVANGRSIDGGRPAPSQPKAIVDKAAPPPTGAAPEAAPWELLSKRQVMLTMGGIVLAMFLAALDQTIVSTAMPKIIADLGGFDKYTWVTTAYLVASTAPVPLIGRLTDMYGRKWFFVGGIAVFLTGSALSGLSQNMTQLVLFRAFQGIGGGIMMANAFVSIGDLFAPADRAKFQGLLAGIFGISSVIGPLLGGFVTDNFSWHWIFYINLPLGIPALILFVLFFPHVVKANRTRKIDYLGGGLLVATVVPLLIGLSLGGNPYAWGSIQVAGSLVAGAVLAVAFVLVELRAAEPIIPPAVLRNPVVSVSFIAIFLTGFVMMGCIAFVPLFFQGVLGTSATNSGSFLIPMMGGLVFGSAVSGQALSRLGGHYKYQGLVGLAIMIAGVFLLSRMTTSVTYAQAAFNLVVLGLGLGITMPLFTIAVQNAVDYKLMGVATSTSQFVRSIGGALGLAILGAFMANRFGKLFAQDLPPDVKAALPHAQLAALMKSPQSLVISGSGRGMQQAFAQAGPQGAHLAAQMLQAIKTALASAITEVFLIGFVVSILALVAVVFLKEIPLKSSAKGRGPAKSKAGAAEESEPMGGMAAL